ncbi:MAG: protein-disulfide reductase DsbD family protein, partial [Planctomycetales bacterium]
MRAFFIQPISCLLGLMVCLGGVSATAQSFGPGFPGGFDVGGGNAGNPVTYSAYFTDNQLSVTAEIAKPFYIYSLTQKSSSASKLAVDPSESFQVVGSFQPDAPPAREGKLEKHKQKVTWTVPLRFADGVAPSETKVTGTFKYIACSEKNCLFPKTAAFVASYQPGAKPVADNSPPVALPAPLIEAPAEAVASGDLESQQVLGEFRATGSPNTLIRGRVEPKQVKPGETVSIILTAEPNLVEHYHVYGLAAAEPKKGPRPTLIALQERPDWKFAASEQPPAKTKFDDIFEMDVAYYEGLVTWTLQFEVPQNAAAGEYPISGLVGYAACADGGSCDIPTGASFQGVLTVAAESSTGSNPLTLAAVPGFGMQAYRAVSKAITNQPDLAVTVTAKPSKTSTAEVATAEDAGTLNSFELDEQESGIAWLLALAFGGGLILNLMPC